MSRPVTVHIGSRTRPETPTPGHRARILTLIGAQAAQRIDGVFAIVDGVSTEVDRAYKHIEKSFGPSSRTNHLPRGMEEDYVATLLATLASGTVSIALAVWFDWDVVVGCCGANQVYISRSGDFLSVGALSAEPGTDGRVRINRFTPSPLDSMALLSSAMTERIQSKEIRNVVIDGFSDAFTPQDAAEWLAGLAQNAGDQVSAVVVQFAPLESLTSSLQKPSASLHAGGASRTVHRGLIAAALTGVLVVAAFLASHRGGGPSSVAANRGTGSSHVVHVPTAAPTPAPPLSRPSSTHAAQILAADKPVQSWKFPPLAGAPHGKVLLALYNPTRKTIATRVRIIGRNGVEVRKVQVKAGGTLKLTLPPGEARDQQQRVTTLYVQGRSPLVPLRVVVGEPSPAAST